MAQTVAIPGRRVSAGETFYTEWIQRGGDCIVLRVEVMKAGIVNEGDLVTISLETRGDDGTNVETITPTEPSGGLVLETAGVATCLYLVTNSTSQGNGAQEQVRVCVGCSGASGAYFVIRIFPLIFFDSAKP